MALPPRFPGLIPAYGAMPLPPMAPISKSISLLQLVVEMS